MSKNPTKTNVTRTLTVIDMSTAGYVTTRALANLQRYVNCVSTAWAGHGVEPVKLVRTKTDATGWRIYITDQSLDRSVKDCYGWHDVKLGVPVGYVDVGACTANQQDVLSVLAHELAEMMGDPMVNQRAVMPDGSIMYRELCDPVQGRLYKQGNTRVSNFVLPSYFDAQGVAPFDYLGVLTKPFEIDSQGGYAIINNNYVFASKAFLKDRCTRRTQQPNNSSS